MKKLVLSLTLLMIFAGCSISEYDEEHSMIFSQDASITHIAETAFYAYIGLANNGEQRLKIRFQYSSKETDFVEQYMITTDNNTYMIEPDYADIMSDDYSDIVLQYYDRDVSNEHIDMIHDIMNSNQTVISYEGETLLFQYTVTAEEKFALQNILLDYETLQKALYR